MSLKKIVFGIATIPLLAAPGAMADNSKAVPGEYIVIASSSQTRSIRQFSNNAYNRMNDLPRRLSINETHEVLLLTMKEDIEVSEAREILSNLEGVQTVEPNYIYYADAIPNDQRFKDTWAFQNIGQKEGTIGADISALTAWDISRGSTDVVVGIIDSGVDYNHPDLQKNMWINPNEIPGNGIDDDNNGFVDDIHGANTESNTGDPMDESDHGTHVAGTIGAVGNNGIGVAGVAWQTKMVACRFLNQSGEGTTADAIKCLEYMIRLKKAGTNIRVINNSWGGGAYSEALQMAIREAQEEGIMFVAAAGNDDIDNDKLPHYPSSYDIDNIISVAATDRFDQLSDFSNYGLSTVDIAAPGSDILSTIPEGGYTYFNGTSMATPHITGAIALILSEAPDATLKEIKDLILEYSDPLDSLQGKILSGKRLNFGNVLSNIDKTPNFRIVPSDIDIQIVQGQTGIIELNVKPLFDWQGNVNFTASSARDLSLVFSTDKASENGTVELEIPTEDSTYYGFYPITIEGLSDQGLHRTITVTVEVLPKHLEKLAITKNDVQEIPDSTGEGLSVYIDIPETFEIYEANSKVNISHTWKGDITLKIKPPRGTFRTLHGGTGGSQDDIIETFDLSAYKGRNAQGLWELWMYDGAPNHGGSFNLWELELMGVYESSPIGDFQFTASDKAVSFLDTSSDAEGEIVSWEWNFGDGNSSKRKNPVHNYEKAGVYNVTLTVSDNSGLSSNVSKEIILN